MPAVSSGKITQSKLNTHRDIIIRASKNEDIADNLGVDLTLAGELDTEIEVVADAIGVLDA